MGSRGKFDSNMGRTGGIPVENREYYKIRSITTQSHGLKSSDFFGV